MGHPEFELFDLERASNLEPDVVHTMAQASRMFYDAFGVLHVRDVQGDINPVRLLHLAYLRLEAALNDVGACTLHAAAVARDASSALLLLGAMGAGKTTTALRLCREHGFFLLANDLVVVGGAQTAVLRGSLAVRLRQASVAVAYPLLNPLFKPSADPWRVKADLRPNDLGLTIGRYPTPIKLVAFVHVDNAYRDVVLEHGDTLQHRLQLHENASRYVRALSTPWLSGKAFGPYVPGGDSEARYVKRASLLEVLLERSVYIAGPPEDLAGALTDLLAIH
jgi:hypothetical protein